MCRLEAPQEDLTLSWTIAGDYEDVQSCFNVTTSNLESLLVVSVETFCAHRVNTFRGVCSAMSKRTGDVAAFEPFSTDLVERLMQLQEAREWMKAGAFIMGMMPPLGILGYIAVYLSCRRGSSAADMFGSNTE